MRTIQEIDNEILALEEKFKTIRGTDTEVYTRIVGYHRAVSNWNKGKREEYDDRLTFKFNLSKPDNMINRLNQASPKESLSTIEVNNKSIAFYKFFTSQTCRNCPPVKLYLKKLSIPGEEVDVTSDLGINVSRKYDIKTTPTVILFDCNDNIITKALSLEELKKILG